MSNEKAETSDHLRNVPILHGKSCSDTLKAFPLNEIAGMEPFVHWAYEIANDLMTE